MGVLYPQLGAGHLTGGGHAMVGGCMVVGWVLPRARVAFLCADSLGQTSSVLR